jgi:hypothetical protein
MKKQLAFLLVCAGLILPGSGFLTNVNAQVKEKRATSKNNVKQNNGKVPSPKKVESLKQIAQSRLSAKTVGNVVGDPCNEAAPITVGQTINNSLSSGDCLLMDGSFIDFYSFEGTAGQPISISYSSSSFDTYLYLLNDAGEILDENDDSGTGTNSRLPVDGGVVTLPFTGTYIIGANSYEPSTGNYSLTLATDIACNATAINYNQTINGSFATTDCAVNLGGEPFYTDRFTFNGTAGQQISIALSSAAVDTYLILHSPTGDTSVADNDGGGGTNSRIPLGSGTLTLTETGTYTIEASTFNSFEVGGYTLVLSGPTVVAPNSTDFDYDGDGKADFSVFRPSVATWFSNSSSNNAFNSTTFGLSSDVIAPADFDGDGKTDISVFRPSTGEWFRLNSSNGVFTAVTFGSNGDIPVAADYDGDNKADVAVFRPSNGAWYRLNSADSSFTAVSFGSNGDRPAIGDFDGDNKADISVFRPSTGDWYRLNSSNSAFVATNFGLGSDLIVPADYDGDNKTDIAVYRSGNWYRLNSSDGAFVAVNFGSSGDVPAPADFDGDGKTDISVFRPSEGVWYQLRSTNGFSAFAFGSNGDIPTPNSRVR